MLSAFYSGGAYSSADPDPRGLEHRPFQRDGEDQPLGFPVLRCVDDVRQLRPLQSPRCYFGRRFLI